MAHPEDPALERVETRLARMKQAKDALDLLAFRLGQIRRRAPYLDELVTGACADVVEAASYVEEEFQETRAERKGGGGRR